MSGSLSRLSTLCLAFILVSAAALPAMTAQAQTVVSAGNGPMIKGSGKLAEQRRTVADFSKIRLEGSFTVEAQQGSGNDVVVRADDNLIELLETVVEGDTLVVRGKPKVSWRTASPMTVRVNFAALEGAELSGSGDLNIRGLKTERFSASVSGSGDMRIDNAQLSRFQAKLAGSGDLSVTGSSQQVDASLAGSGDIDLSKLLARQSTVKLAGSGDINVHASESADVSIVGSGDVRVYGQPKAINRRVVGGGDIHLK